MTGDEEDAGEPLADAREALVDAAKGAAYAIGFEDGPGDPTHAVVARRGTTAWTLRVKAQPAHSSQIFREDIGSGAIFEAARILNAFREKLAGEPHLTFNPGAIVGGTVGGVRHRPGPRHGVRQDQRHRRARDRHRRPAHAVARAAREGEEERWRRSSPASLPHTQATITFEDGYPPLAPTEGNHKLLAMYDQASRDVGAGPVTAVDPDRAGAADVSFVAGEVKMILDGVGLMGSDDHTVNETADLATLPSQTKRAAVLLHLLAKAQ